MFIEVLIDSWEQQCCGVAHKVGEPSTFLIYLMPDGRPLEATDGTRTRFPSDRHDQIPEGRDQRTVTGIVRSIHAIEYGVRPSPGEPGVMTRDPDARSVTAVARISTSHEVHAIDGELEAGSPEWFWDVAGEFMVTLDVSDDICLPTGA